MALNEYDDLVERMAGGSSTPPPMSERAQAMPAPVMPQAPDPEIARRSARIQDFQAQTQLPLDVIERNYDSFLGDKDSASVSSGPSPFAQILREEREDKENQLKNSFYKAKDTEPERQARVLSLSQRSGLPADLVARNFEEISKQYRNPDLDYADMAQRHPKTAEWVSDPNNAALVKDDLGSLENIEQRVNKLKPSGGRGFFEAAQAFPAEIETSFKTGWNSLNTTAWLLGAGYGLTSPEEAAQKISEAQKRNQALQAHIPQYARQYSEMSTKESADVDKALAYLRSGRELEKQGDVLGAIRSFFVGGAQTVGETLDLIASSVARPRGLIYSTTESLAHSFPALLSGAVGTVAGTAALVNPVGGVVGGMAGAFIGGVPVEVGGWMSESLSKRGIDMTDPAQVLKALKDTKLMSELRAQAERKGLTTAGVDAIFNGFAGKLTKGAKTFGAKAAHFAGETAFQSVGEVASEHLGKGAAYKGDFSQVSLGESISEGISSLGHSAGEVFIGKSQRVLYPQDTITAAQSLAIDTQSALQAQHQHQVMSEILEIVKVSKLYELSPEKLQEYLKVVAQGQHVYFQTEDWDEHFKAKGESPVKAADDILGGGGAARYGESQSTGSLIEVPMAEFLARLAGREDSAELLKLVRTPDGKNFNEAKAHLESLPATMEELGEEVSDRDDARLQADIQNRLNQDMKVLSDEALGKDTQPLVTLDLGDSDEVFTEKLGWLERAQAYEAQLVEKLNTITEEIKGQGEQATPELLKAQHDLSALISKVGELKPNLKPEAVSETTSLSPDQIDFEGEAKKVKNNIKAKLKAIGVNDSIADKKAEKWGAFFGTQGKRFNKSPWKMFEPYKVQIGTGGPGGTPRQSPTSMAQPHRVFYFPVVNMGDHLQVSPMRGTHATARVFGTSLVIENIRSSPVYEGTTQDMIRSFEIMARDHNLETMTARADALTADQVRAYGRQGFMGIRSSTGEYILFKDLRTTTLNQDDLGDSDAQKTARQTVQSPGPDAGRGSPGRPAGQEALTGALSTIATPLEGLPKNSPGPHAQIKAISERYIRDKGLNVPAQTRYVKADPARGKRIADAYTAMKHDPTHPDVQAAYQALITETMEQYELVKELGITVEVIKEGQDYPYPEGPRQVLEDLKRGHLWLFPTVSGFGTLSEINDNPLLAPTNETLGEHKLVANDIFRIVHDVFGHGKEGVGFGSHGEENAWQSHVRMYSPLAARAMTSETRGQNSWVNFGPHGEANRANAKETVYGDQKAGLLPEWVMREGLNDDLRVLYQQDIPPPPQLQPTRIWFFSQLKAEVAKMNFGTMPAPDLIGRIKNLGGIKAEELEATGILDWLTLKDSAQVSRDEVLQFLDQNGLDLKQTMLSGDFEGESETPELEGVSWSEPKRTDLTDRYQYRENVNSEIESRLEDDYWVKERTQELRDERIDEYTDEDTGNVDESGLSDSIERSIHDEAEESAEEYVSSDDYSMARYEVEETSTGKTLEGNDEYGWYSDTMDKHFDNLEEAKIQLIGYLLDQGELEGNVRDLIRPGDIKWETPYGVKPSRPTFDKNAKAHLAKNRDRLLKQAIEENGEYYKDDTPEERAKHLEVHARHLAEAEVTALYDDPANARNKINMPIDHPILDGKVSGNNKNGWVFTSDKLEGEVKLQSKTLQDSKAEVIKLLVDKEIISPEKQKPADQTQAEIDINEPTGKAPFDDFVVEGGTNYRVFLLTLPGIKDKFIYTSHYGDRENIIGFVRLTDRIDEKGRRILVAEEIQSDWMQQGRDFGFRSEYDIEKLKSERSNLKDQWAALETKSIQLNAQFMERARQTHPEDINEEYRRLAETEEFTSQKNPLEDQISELQHKLEDVDEQIKESKKAVPDVPVTKTETWSGLLVKRLISLAIEQGYEGVAIMPGEVHSKRWGSESISWVKREGEGFEIVDKDGKIFKSFGPLTTRDEAHAEFDRMKTPGKEFEALASKMAAAAQTLGEHRHRDNPRLLEGLAVREGLISEGELQRFLELTEANFFNINYKPRDFSGYTLEKPSPHWLVGSVEQVGGQAGGINIEEQARERGHLLEKKGVRITSQAELRELMKEVLTREYPRRKLDTVSASIWKQMQEKDSGVKFPRKEGLEFFYNNMLAKNVVPAILKKLDKDIKLGVTEFDTGEMTQAQYEGPQYTVDELRAKLKADPPADKDVADTLNVIIRRMDRGGESFADAVEGTMARSAETAAYLGGKLNSPVPKKQKAWSFPLTDTLKQKALGGFTLFQKDQGPKKDDPRGQISWGPERHFNIDLLKDANLSTFLHESGHFFLEVMGDLAETAQAPAQVREDYQTILEWMGVKSRREITDEHHEKWARGVETYAKEGKAPSEKLREAFNHFFVWLNDIYKGMKSVNVELTPEVRAVMDRMLATDEEIEKAKGGLEPSFEKSPEAWGLKGPKLEAYKKAVDRTRVKTREIIRRQLFEDLLRVDAKFYKQKRAALYDEVLSELGSLREYRALAALQSDIEQAPGEGALRISTQSLKDIGAVNMPRKVSSKDGIHVEIVAGMLGYLSGSDLVQALSGLASLKDAAEAETEDRMREFYPDSLTSGVISEDALNAYHNENRSEVLHLELEHLASDDMPILKEMIRRVARRPPSLKEVREAATRMIGKKRVSDIKPHLFLRAERKAAKEAGIFLAQGDFDKASEAKYRELLNHELYRSSVEAKDTVERSLKFFKRLANDDEQIAKTRDIDLVYAGRAILKEFGLDYTDKPVSAYLEILKRDDPEGYDAVMSQVELATERTGPYETVAFDDFNAMKEIVEALWGLAKHTRGFELDGRRLDRLQVQAELEEALAKSMTPANKQAYTQATSTWDKTEMALLGMQAALTRTESWVDIMDLGDPDGAFRKYLLHGIFDGTAEFREQKKVYLQKYLDIVKQIEDRLKDPKPIVSPELKHKFAGLHELLGAMSHIGNESNFRKLLLGRGWAEAGLDGEIDTSRWDGFIKRLQDDGSLTSRDYDFLQAVWDLNEELKPQAQKVHRKRYGFNFNEITAREVLTPWKTYRGGYVPAIADPFLVPAAQVRADRESLEKSNNSFMFPSAGRGFTKARVENYTVPLIMDIRMMPAHIDKVLRFIHIEPAVNQVARIVMSRDFRKMLDAYDPTIASDMLVPWLQRTAQQKISHPTQGRGGQGLDTMCREVRSRTGMQIMAGNVINAAQQITGLSVAAAQVELKHLRNALWTYSRQPSKIAAMVASKSKAMRTRLNQSSYEIQGHIEDLILNPSKYEQAREFAKKHGYFFQAATQNVVDIVVWVGAYDQAVAKGAGELSAVRQADSAVRMTQGSFNAEDISRFETGTPFVRMFTHFFSYFNMLSNFLKAKSTIVYRQMGLRKGAGRLLYIYALGFMIPAVVNELIIRAASGKGLDEDDDDEYLDDLMSIFFGSQFRLLTAMVPVAGPVINSGINAWNDKWYDDRITTSPAVSMIERSVKSPKSVYEAIAEGKSKKTAVRDTLTALGLLTNLPLAPLSRPIGYGLDVMEGRAKPSGPIDFTRGMVTGKSGQQP